MRKRLLPFVIIFNLALLLWSCGKDVAPQKTTGSITFVITEENTPQTLSEVAIQLFFDEDKSITQSDRTDKSGRCTFSDIPVGTYSVNLSKPGYESKEGLALRITGGDNPSKEIALKRITTVLTVQPEMLDFGADESVCQKAFSIVNPNYVDLTWAALDTDVPWVVSVCDKDGKKNGSIKYNQEVAMSVTIDRAKLAIGSNETTIVILSDNGRAELTVKAIGADTRTLPTTNMLEVTDVDMSSATFKGEILSVGAPEYTERGFVYSRSSIPADATSGFTQLTAAISSNKTFSASVNDLNNGYKYFVRAYAKNAIGLKLSSNEISFETIGSMTKVSTKDVTKIDAINGKAVFNGDITNIGSPEYSEKGFCFNQSGEPTISDTKVTVSGTKGGTYSYSYVGLTTKTTYYVKAYAIQNGKTYYGTSVVFSTDKSSSELLPKVKTDSYTSSTNYLEISGSVTTETDLPIIRQGVCWSKTNTTPSLGDNVVLSNNSSSPFSCTIEDLSPGTTYYCRAFAENAVGVGYGESKKCNTQAITYSKTIFGYVLDQDGKPISGAKIIENNRHDYSATTDNNGYYSITLNRTASGKYEFYCEASGYDYSIREVNNIPYQPTSDWKFQLDFTLNLKSNFAINLGDGRYIDQGGAMNILFECHQSSQAGTTTTKMLHIKNNRSVPVSWSASNIPSKGIIISPQNGNIPAKGDIEISLKFTYPSPTTTSAKLVNSSNGKKLYVWPWDEFYVDCYNNGTDYLQPQTGAAFCQQAIWLSIGGITDGFSVMLNQFVTYS